jgi:hypothetical protein
MAQRYDCHQRDCVRSVSVDIVKNAQDAEEEVDEVEIKGNCTHDILVGAKSLGDDVCVIYWKNTTRVEEGQDRR